MRRVLVLAIAFATLACNRSNLPEPEDTAVNEPVATPVAEDETFCAMGSPDAWSSCEGQRVKLEGREPQMVAQHPMQDYPDEKGERFQSYLEVGGVQVVVLTHEPVACEGERTVIGVLRSVSLGGEPGTKESYEGWSVDDAAVTCK